MMLHQQGRAQNSAYSGAMSSSQRSRKCDKDSNFNFLPSREVEGVVTASAVKGDQNRNQVRPRNLSPLGRDPPPSSPSPSSPSSSSSSPGFHHGPGPLSPLSRLPCWSPLEPLPEIESGDDGYGRASPDGAEEGKMEEGEEGEEKEESQGRTLAVNSSVEEKGRGRREGGVEYQSGWEGKGEEEEGLEGEEEWGDSDSDFEFSYRSGGSLSSLNMESGGEGLLMGGWDRVGVGEPGDRQAADNARLPERSAADLPAGAGRRTPVEDEGDRGDRSSDSEAELPEPLADAVWTLRDRERFKAQEMEKHQVQLTMYRRLALIRWVRALQGRVQEQQNRLQSSFDVILTHRKELLRMGATATVAAATPTAAVGQS